MAEMWKPDDQTPHWGNKARAWLRRSIQTRIEALCKAPRATLGADDIPGIMEWLLDLDDADERRYVEWVDADAWRGRHYSNGEWQIRWQIVEADVADAVVYARRKQQREHDAERIGSLDDWLSADIDGTLVFPGCWGGGFEIPERQRNVLAAAARAREKRRPIECADCGELFTRDRRNARRCPRCRQAVRIAKEAKTVTPQPRRVQ